MKYCALLIFSFLFLSLNAQVKGKAKHLPGVWKYNEGTGYEIWQMNGNSLIGKGYRVNKNGDSVLIEQITITPINKNLTLKLETPNLDTAHNVNIFVSEGKSLDFENISISSPKRLRFKFGCFNKNKLKIFLYYPQLDKAQKLVLTKQ